MVEHYHISSTKMAEIIQKKRIMQDSIIPTRIKIVLYENPEGAKRPRFRLIGKSNYVNEAILHPSYVHVYSPNAADDHKYMHRLVESELQILNAYVQTPCYVTINAFFKTPSSFNVTDKVLAEIGLHRNVQKPDWDNIGKKYSDMFNENIWLDDNLVISGTVNKFYSIKPRIEIYVDYLNCVTTQYYYDKITGRKDYNTEYPIHYLDKFGRII